MRLISLCATLVLLLLSTSMLGQSPANLTANIPWGAGYSTNADIETAFNDARTEEEVQLGLTAGSIATMTLPAGYSSMTDNEKALWILNDERVARDGIDYGSGGVLGLPMEDIELQLDDLAQSHAEWLMDNSTTGHTGACGNSPFDRIDNYPVIGVCHEFLARGENIAYFWSTGSISFPIERSFYNWIYDDAGSAWGHREACLLQDQNLAGQFWGYTNNSGPGTSEGFLGIGRMSGSHNGWPNAEIIVMKIIDPQASCTAVYAPESAAPSTLIPSSVPTIAGTYNADRSIFEELTGLTHYIDDGGTALNFSDDKLLLSVDRDQRFIGDLGDCTMDVKVIVNNSTVHLTTATAPYVTDAVGWFCMERYWDVTPTMQPLQDVGVRHYFTTAEYNDLVTDVTAAGGSISAMTDLYFYKAENESPDDHINIDPSEYHEFPNGTSSLNSWALGSYAGANYSEYMVSSFSGGGGGAGAGGAGALPVELSLFEVAKRNLTVDLYWETASEVNNDFFTIERSTNGRDFEELVTVQGSRTTYLTSEYNYEDLNPMVGYNFYRLKQTDIDGTTSIISDIKSVMFDASLIGFEVYPNPISNQVTLKYNTEASTLYEVRDITGKLITTGSLKADKKAETIESSSWQTGVYMIQLVSGTNSETIKVVKE